MSSFNPIAASRAVRIEVLNVLGAFRDQIVLVGGWVPELLYPNRGHPGSLDVDLAVSRYALGGNVYQTILQRLLNAGYTHVTGPTRFTKPVAGVEEPVKVDLISGQYESGQKSKSIQVDQLEVNTLRGTDLAFEACREIHVCGRMPDGTHNTVSVRIVEPQAFILIKAFALDERLKEKDAYDIYFVLRNYRPNVESLAGRVHGLLSNGLARAGFDLLKLKSATLQAVGPSWAAQMAAEQGEDHAQAQRSAYEYAQALFTAVDQSQR